LTQETVGKQNAAEISLTQEPKRVEKKQVSVQELVDSLKSAADDIGQINELSSEEKLLVAQFFTSLLKLMKPLTPAISVSTAALPDEAEVAQAFIDPTGHLAMMHQDGRMELKNLSDERNRDLMIAVVSDVMPKFKSLTSAQKRKIESRIKFISAVTKEVQKISDTLAAVMSTQ
jgi:hypothetical protein